MNTLTVFLTKEGVDDDLVQSEEFPTPLKARSAFLQHAFVLEDHGFVPTTSEARWTDDGSDLLEEVVTLQHTDDSGWAQLVVRYLEGA